MKNRRKWAVENDRLASNGLNTGKNSWREKNFIKKVDLGLIKKIISDKQAKKIRTAKKFVLPIFYFLQCTIFKSLIVS
jgi:hypothetical protein